MAKDTAFLELKMGKWRMENVPAVLLSVSSPMMINLSLALNEAAFIVSPDFSLNR